MKEKFPCHQNVLYYVVAPICGYMHPAKLRKNIGWQETAVKAIKNHQYFLELTCSNFNQVFIKYKNYSEKLKYLESDGKVLADLKEYLDKPVIIVEHALNTLYRVTDDDFQKIKTKSFDNIFLSVECQLIPITHKLITESHKYLNNEKSVL